MSSEQQQYFETPQLRQCIGKVYDAVIKERGIFYLKGPAGAGKTLFAERLTKLFASRYRVLLLAVNPMVEIQSLIRGELGLPAAEEDDWPPPELVEKTPDQPSLLLIIDDAELLAKQDVRALWKLHKTGVVVLFIGKGGFAGGLQLKNIHEHDIPLLTRRQCREYLSAQGVSIPADGTLDEIFAKTEGRPGGIDEVSLHSNWRSTVDEEAEAAEDQLLGKGGIATISGLLLVVLAVWLYMQYAGPQEVKKVQPPVTEAIVAIPRPPQKPYQIDESVEIEPVITDVVGVASETQVAPVVTLPAVATVSPVNQSGTIIADRQWLMAQDPLFWTLQVAGAWNEQVLRTQLSKMKLVDKYAIFIRHRQGKAWYSLVVGVYPNAATATVANVDISKKFGVNDAWVRSFADIHKVLSKQ